MSTSSDVQRLISCAVHKNGNQGYRMYMS